MEMAIQAVKINKNQNMKLTPDTGGIKTPTRIRAQRA